MPRRNGHLPAKQVSTWFADLDFQQQETCLRELAHLHATERAKHIAALRKQLAALGEIDAPKPLRGRKKLRKAKAVASKYRDPKSGETWSGRGRMARWLAAKVKAGEKVAKYLIR